MPNWFTNNGFDDGNGTVAQADGGGIPYGGNYNGTDKSYTGGSNDFNEVGAIDNGGIAVNNAATGGSPFDQFYNQVKAAYPSKGEDYWRQQANYFVGKLNSGERMGNGQVADMNYWMDRAAGQGAGGADVAEAGKYAGQNFGTLEQQQGNAGWGNFDPFSYSGGSLLTPWTQALPENTPVLAGAGSVKSDPLKFNQFNYAAPQNTTPFNTPAAYNPQSFSGPKTVNAPQFGAPATYNPDKITGPGEFAAPQSGGSFTNPYGDGAAGQFAFDKYEPAAKFEAPKLDETNDPGYEFRRKEGERAMMNRASQQGARGGDVLKALGEYNQNYASNEYGNVYNRALTGFNTNESARQAAYGANWTTASGVRDRNFGEATTGYGLNMQNNQANANNQMATNQLNSQNWQAVAGLNANQGLQAAQLNSGNQLAANQLASNNWQTAAGLNQQGELSTNQLNSSQALGAAQLNSGNQLSTNQLNAQQQQANNALGWQIASGVQGINDANNQNAWSANYQMENAYAQAMAAQQAQQYAQTMGQYGMAYDIYNNNQNSQFNKLYSMAGLGVNAASAANGAGANYANNYGNLVTGQGNANASGIIGSANNWMTGIGNLGNQAQIGVLANSPWLNSRTPTNGAGGVSFTLQ